MKCIYCGKDSNHKDRLPGHRCASCRKRFAFEPVRGDPFTDKFFESAARRVSSDGKIRWVLDNLYYEVCRSLWKRAVRKAYVYAVLPSIVLIVIGLANFPQVGSVQGIAVLVALVVVVFLGFQARARRPVVRLLRSDFDVLWEKWMSAHGIPEGYIDPKDRSVKPSPELETDIADYSFDRAIICDRRETVDVLLYNNFHFENNCAVLSHDGYPEESFATVLQMIRNNPEIEIFALHDCTVKGCMLANHLGSSGNWFQGGPEIQDIGLRPDHVRGLKGCYLEVTGLDASRAGTLTAKEARFLASYAVEFAATRPQGILRRVFNALSPDGGSGFG